MDITKLFKDHRIPFSTEHKNIRDGWIGLEDCPFCGSRGKYHLGYNTYENYFSCWQCGGHSSIHSISKILGVNWKRAEEIVGKYGGTVKSYKEHRVRVGTKKFKLPSGDLSLQKQHKLYLKKRSFDWEYLEDVWRIKGTEPMSELDGLYYSFRILAPIYWDGQLVTFQARDITDKHMAKYMACPPEYEIISHKHILYGIQEHWQERGICVEGIFDAWRLGTGAFATFGVKYTREQIRAIVTHFKEVVVAFDPEPVAQMQAQKLVDELEYKGVKAWKIDLPCDPGALTQDDADYIVKQILT